MRFGEQIGFVHMVETTHDFASQFKMCRLVFAYGYAGCFVEHNVCCHQNRITQEAIGVQIFVSAFKVTNLIFVSRNAFQPAQRSAHTKKQCQFSMFFNMGLNEDYVLIRINACAQPVNCHFHNVFLQFGSICIRRSQSVQVNDGEETFIFMLQAYPVFQRAHVVTQMEAAGRLHSAKNSTFVHHNYLFSNLFKKQFQ